jgi:hypothetical protein
MEGRVRRRGRLGRERLPRHEALDRERVQKALGHADPRSTDHYVVLADRDTIEIFRDREK